MTCALIFDCDGVLIAENEDIHLAAFNRTWAESGVPWAWTPDDYRSALSRSGGRERLRALMAEPNFKERVELPDDACGIDALVESWHKRKTEIYVELIASLDWTPRPGIQRLSEAAASAGWKLAVASSGTFKSVEAVLARAVGKDLFGHFSIFSGDTTITKKPAPDVYHEASLVLGVHPSRCVAIEDSRNGVAAATAAGMPCVATPTSTTIEDDFSEASLVVSSLGDPSTPAAMVLRGRRLPPNRHYIVLDDLTRLIDDHIEQRSIALE